MKMLFGSRGSAQPADSSYSNPYSHRGHAQVTDDENEDQGPDPKEVNLKLFAFVRFLIFDEHF